MRMTLLASAAALALSTAPSIVAAQDSAAATTTLAPAPDGTTTVTTTDITTARPAPNAGSNTTDMAQKNKPYAMTVQQKTTFATWPSERQSAYEAWPIDYKTYYWTLTPVQQEGYWALAPDQRGQIYRMSPEQRAVAWKSIQQQLAGETPTTPAGQANPPGEGVPTAGVPNPQAANQAAQPAMPADESYQGGPYKGALTPPPADAMSKNYPVCSRTVTDACRNPGSK